MLRMFGVNELCLDQVVGLGSETGCASTTVAHSGIMDHRRGERRPGVDGTSGTA